MGTSILKKLVNPLWQINLLDLDETKQNIVANKKAYLSITV